MLLCTWLSNCSIAVTHFLHNPANVPFVSLTCLWSGTYCLDMTWVIHVQVICLSRSVYGGSAKQKMHWAKRQNQPFCCQCSVYTDLCVRCTHQSSVENCLSLPAKWVFSATSLLVFLVWIKLKGQEEGFVLSLISVLGFSGKKASQVLEHIKLNWDLYLHCSCALEQVNLSA